MATQRKCIVCGTDYEYCPKCGQYANEPKWKIEYDKQECKDLFETVSAFNMGLKSISDLEYVVKTYNITDYSKYKEGIQKALGKISVVEAPVVVESTVVEEPVIVEEPIVASTFNKKKKKNKWYETIEETPVEETPNVDIALNEEISNGVSEE